MRAPNQAALDDEFFPEIARLMRQSPEAHKGPTNLWESWMAFSSAVDWHERFLLFLLAFHVIFILLVIWTRHVWKLQALLLTLALLLVLSAQRLNMLANNHWQKFSSQNYFDPSGSFIMFVLCGPLVLDAIGMSLWNVYQSSQMLVRVKRLQLRAQALAKHGGKHSNRIDDPNSVKAQKQEKQGEGSAKAQRTQREQKKGKSE
eukprot:g68111.t1